MRSAQGLEEKNYDTKKTEFGEGQPGYLGDLPFTDRGGAVFSGGTRRVSRQRAQKDSGGDGAQRETTRETEGRKATGAKAGDAEGRKARGSSENDRSSASHRDGHSPASSRSSRGAAAD